MTTLTLIAVIVAALVALYFWATACGKPAERWLTEYLYAHRGLHNEAYPENSMASFMNAVEKGYGIELDIHLSKDGEIMVFHDERLDRMTGKSGKVSDYTAQELIEMKLGNTKHTIPTLKDVLRQVNGKVPLLIETKNEINVGDLEQKLSEILETYHGKYAVQSFSPFSIGWFKKNAPHVLRGQLSSEFREGVEEIAHVELKILQKLFTNFLCRPNFISYEVCGLSQIRLQRFRKTGIPVLAWTVRSESEQQKRKPLYDTIIFECYEAKK